MEIGWGLNINYPQDLEASALIRNHICELKKKKRTANPMNKSRPALETLGVSNK